AVLPRVVQRGNAAIITYNPDAYGYQYFTYPHLTHIWFPRCPNPNVPDCPKGAEAEGFQLVSEVADLANKGHFDETREQRVRSPLGPQFGPILDKFNPVWYFGRKATSYKNDAGENLPNG